MKRMLRGAAAALLAVGLLTGCGGEKDVSLAQMDVDQYVTLCDYNNLSVTVAPPEVDEKELIRLIADTYVHYMPADIEGIVDREVELWDTVNIDYVGKLDGVPFGNGSAEGDLLTIGSSQFISGFEDGLIGVMPGETVDLELSFPDPYPNNPDLAGQAVVFTVTVNFIIPIIDEVIPYMEIPNVSTVEEFRQYAYDYLYQIAQSDYESFLQSAILSALLEQCEFGEIPEKLLEESKQTLRQNIQTTAEMYGITAEEFALYNGTTLEKYVELYAPDGAKQNLALQAIANREGLTVDDEELQSQLEEYALIGGHSSVEEFIDDIPMEDFRNYFMSVKVMDYLKERVQVNP